jgi:DNA-binding PadR family transcriptional regulator
MSRPRLPGITHLQFLVLGNLLSAAQPGRAIREALAGYGVRRSGPAFYQLMARLERDGLVEGWYEQIAVDGHAVMERHYRIKPGGSKLWADTRAFYERVSAASTRERWSNA